MEKPHILHDLDNPGAQPFDSWQKLLTIVTSGSITGYAVDSMDTVVRFRKGKRKDVTGKWVTASILRMENGK